MVVCRVVVVKKTAEAGEVYPKRAAKQKEK
jgi:hypothetical protein